MTDDLLGALLAIGDVPQHVAIIMDGNGRWARHRRLPRPVGHRAGMKAVRESVQGCLEAGVRYLTLYAFSQENWSRPPTEVSALMRLLDRYIAKETGSLRDHGVRTRIIGDRSRLTSAARTAVERVEEATAAGERLELGLCISYSGRDEITRAARALAEDVRAGRLHVDDIDEASLADRLLTAGRPDPDLLIRTSGEHRVSNFLLWQLAYTELHVTPVLWPDFSRQDLFRAVVDYQHRERRFGRVTA